MADTPTTSGKYRKQGLGDRSAAWGLSSGLNGVFDSLDEAIHGVNVVSLATTNYTLTSTNYTSNETRQKFHRFTDGGIASQATINVPAVDNWWVVSNGISAQSLLVSNGANSVNVAAGQTAIVGNDGTNMYAFPFATSFISADPGTNGVVVRTSEGVTTARTLTGTAEQITVTHGSGVSGNPTISLPTRVRIGAQSATASPVINVQAAINVEVPRNSGDTYIVGTTTSKNAAERLTLAMASNADGDQNDLRAGIELGTVTSNDALGSDSYISMYTNNYGASRDVRLHIDKDGNVGIGTTTPGALLDVAGAASIQGNTTLGDAAADTLTINAGTYSAPNIPLVHAYVSSSVANVTGDSTFYTVIFDTEVFDQGSDYNNSTGVFTAPTTGKYLITTHIRVSGMSSNNTRLSGQIVASNKTYSFCESDPYACASSDNRYGFGASIILDMDAADTVYVRFVVEATDKVVDLDGSDPTWVSIQQVA